MWRKRRTRTVGELMGGLIALFDAKKKPEDFDIPLGKPLKLIEKSQISDKEFMSPKKPFLTQLQAIAALERNHSIVGINVCTDIGLGDIQASDIVDHILSVAEEAVRVILNPQGIPAARDVSKIPESELLPFR
jgi:hypothetical protein